jgi:hypothetical protein
MMIDCLTTFGRNRAPSLLVAAVVGAAFVAAPVHKAAAVEMSPAAKASSTTINQVTSQARNTALRI